ncbi:MAG: hypothetical protein WBV77_08050 [Solirubrobacteraceae bacterium]
MTSDTTLPPLTDRLACVWSRHRSRCQQTIDPREGAIQTPGILAAAAARKRDLTNTQPGLQILPIDQDAPVHQELGEKARLSFSVPHVEDIDSSTDGPRELRAEIDNALKARVLRIA